MINVRTRPFLGGTPWLMEVLHTTNRNLGYHPHVHVIIGGVGWDESKDQLVSVRNADFLFPARLLASAIRGRLLSAVKAEVRKGKLVSQDGPVAPGTASGRSVLRTVDSLWKVNWQVRTKRAMGGPAQVIRYLGRYTHRTAISNSRLVSMSGGTVTYRGRGRSLHRVRLEEFARRFSRHVLPKGFVRVRRCGLLSPRKRKELLGRVQAAALAHARVRNWLVQLPSLLKEQGFESRCGQCSSLDVTLVGMDKRLPVPWRFSTRGIPPPGARAGGG